MFGHTFDTVDPSCLLVPNLCDMWTTEHQSHLRHTDFLCENTGCRDLLCVSTIQGKYITFIYVITRTLVCVMMWWLIRLYSVLWFVFELYCCKCCIGVLFVFYFFVLNKPLNVDVMRMVFDTCMLSFINKIYKTKLLSEKVIGNYHRIYFSIKFKEN